MEIVSDELPQEVRRSLREPLQDLRQAHQGRHQKGVDVDLFFNRLSISRTGLLPPSLVSSPISLPHLSSLKPAECSTSADLFPFF